MGETRPQIITTCPWSGGCGCAISANETKTTTTTTTTCFIPAANQIARLRGRRRHRRCFLGRPQRHPHLANYTCSESTVAINTTITSGTFKGQLSADASGNSYTWPNSN